MADSNRTEKPTGRRILRARREGHVLVSREMITASQFLVVVALFTAWFPGWLDGMKAMLRQGLEVAFQGDFDMSRAPGIGRALLERAFVPFSGLAVAAILTALAAHLAVTKLAFNLNKFIPDFTRFNPATKIRQIAEQAPGAVFRACAMLIIFSGVVYVVARQNAEIFLSIPFASLPVGLAKIGESLKQLLWKAAAVFVLFAVLDVVRQQKRYMKGLRMTKQEVKDEAKEMEGDPHVRGKIKRLRRDLARKRMMKEVATATAVVVNPTHYAVALRYAHENMATPIVVAKGKNYLALRIRQLAIENNVPLVENPPLAQALYKSVDVGREIPPHLYRAVAEVLAYIYRLNFASRTSKRTKPGGSR